MAGGASARALAAGGRACAAGKHRQRAAPLGRASAPQLAAAPSCSFAQQRAVQLSSAPGPPACLPPPHSTLVLLSAPCPCPPAQELALHAPAVFNVHVRAFIEVIWNPLRDPKLQIREAAVAALQVRPAALRSASLPPPSPLRALPRPLRQSTARRPAPPHPTRPQACLVLVEKRETRYRVQWYYRLFEETQRGLTRVTSLETVHGSLLALGELLRHTGGRARRGGERGDGAHGGVGGVAQQAACVPSSLLFAHGCTLW